MAVQVVNMYALGAPPSADNMMLHPVSPNLLGEKAGKWHYEMEANRITGQRTDSPCKLVKKGVGQGAFERKASSTELGFVCLELFGAAADFVKERYCCFPVQEVVGVSDHG